MKTRIIAVLSLLALSSYAHAANLQNRFFGKFAVDRSYYSYKPYTSVGVGPQVPTTEFRNYNNGLAVFAGYRWHTVGAQVSAAWVQPVNYYSPFVNDIHIKQRSYNYAIDALYFIPVWNNIELKGLLGLGVLNTKFETTIAGHTPDQFTKSSAGLGVRVGGGVQYAFNDHLAVDAMLTFQGPGNNAVKNVVGGSIGVIVYV